jgi:hypothetical protein
MAFPVIHLQERAQISQWDFSETIDTSKRYAHKNPHIHWKTGLRSQVFITASLVGANAVPFTGNVRITVSSIAVQEGEVHFWVDIANASGPQLVMVRGLTITTVLGP